GHSRPTRGGHRGPQGETEGFESSLGHVMTIAAANQIDVDRRPKMNRKCAPELFDDLGLERPDATAQRYVVGEKRPLPKIYDDAGERFVQRRVGGRETGDAVTVAHRLRQRLAQHDARVLDQAVSIDLQIARAAQPQVESAVARHLLQHVSRYGGFDL